MFKNKDEVYYGSIILSILNEDSIYTYSISDSLETGVFLELKLHNGKFIYNDFPLKFIESEVFLMEGDTTKVSKYLFDIPNSYDEEELIFMDSLNDIILINHLGGEYLSIEYNNNKYNAFINFVEKKNTTYFFEVKTPIPPAQRK